jgi:transcriptional regulator with XRE-family HTH domain
MENRAASTQQSGLSLGDRVAARRNCLGLTLEAVAVRAGMATSYLEYVESQRGHPSAGVLRRLAEVLNTTPEHLYGEQVLEPSLHFSRRDEQPEAGGSPHVVSWLSAAECLLLLGSVPVGRVAFVVNGPPLVLPVNFTLQGTDVIIQTAAMSPLAEMARGRRLVSFEVDDIDEPSRLGWSVLCHGPTRLAMEADQRSDDLDALTQPWIGSDRRTVVVLSPTQVTGRRIAPG